MPSGTSIDFRVCEKTGSAADEPTVNHKHSSNESKAKPKANKITLFAAFQRSEVCTSKITLFPGH